MNIISQFIAVIGSVWMLALAYKIVGDTWDVLFSARYKEWLNKHTKKGKEKVAEVLNGKTPKDQEQFI